MPNRTTPAQIRGARALLDWSMLDLARAARVSISTVKRFEGEGDQPVSPGTVAVIQDALQTEGVRFLDDDGSGPGIRLQKPSGREERNSAHDLIQRR